MNPAPLAATRLVPVGRLLGFTLIEMLISLTIMLILFSMMYGFGSKRNQMTQKQRCQGNLQKIFIGLQIYANEHGERFPVVTNALTAEDALDVLVPQYTADTAIFICPGSKDDPLPPGVSLRKGQVSYSYYMGRRASEPPAVLLTDQQVNTDAKPAGAKLFSETGKKPGNNHHKYGGNLLWSDGSVTRSPSLAAVALPVETNVVLLNPKP
jgi:prepilin-type N-terminal cleavage/methylation domain-containing protein